MKVIGVVGGIGSGKSYVAGAFARLGAAILDADQIGHDILNDPDVIAQLCTAFGDEVLTADGLIDRKAIAVLVFEPGRAGEQRLRQLESITHPRIEAQLHSALAELRRRGTLAVVLDAAIMIQTGWHRYCDELVFVEADEETRWRRVAERGWTRAGWQSREARQLPLATLKSHCSATILNGGQVSPSVDEQAYSLWQQWGLADAASPLSDKDARRLS